MKIILKAALTIIGIIAITGFLVLYLSLNSIVKNGIEREGSVMTGTGVTVQSVRISPFTGKGTIRGFKVANPEGYQHDYAIEVDDFTMVIDIRSVFSDEIIVEELIVTDPFIYVEQQLPQNNINTIYRHINQTSPAQTTYASLVILRFRMSGTSAILFTQVGGERTAEIELETIEIENLGRGGGQEAAVDVIKEISEQIAERILRDVAQSGTGQILDALQGLFD